MYADILERQQSLQNLFERAEDLKRTGTVDSSVRSALEAYLCVRTYAYLEASVRSIVLQHVRQVSSDDSIENFVTAQLERQRNLNYGVLIDLLGRFSAQWVLKLKSSVNEIPKLNESLDGLVRLRNKISHGDDVDISLKVLHGYFVSAQQIVQFVFDACTADFTSTANA